MKRSRQWRGARPSGTRKRGALSRRARTRRGRTRRAVLPRSWRRRPNQPGGPAPRAPRRPAWLRRAVLAAAMLAVVFFPVPGPASGQQPAACRGCRAQPADAQRWVARLSGDWSVGAGTAGTVPASGQAYVAVGDGIAVVGTGLDMTAFRLRDGAQLWQVTLSAATGSSIISVRAWPGVVTAGVVGPGGRTRTEVVIGAATGVQLAQYPAAVFGGAVAASATTTVVVGPTGVTSFDNASAAGKDTKGRKGPRAGQGPRVRWQRQTGAGQSWRTDGGTLYVAESAGGYLGSAPVTSLRVINLGSGAERTLHSPPGHAFAGTMALAAEGVVLFTSASGVTAYSGSTGLTLWSMPAAVPEGADPAAGLIYLTQAGGALVGVDPLTGTVRTVVSGATAGGSAGIYVVRGGVALGLDNGQAGEAWGYDTAAGRVTWTAPGLPWPHYFADLSGLGGSAEESGTMVVVAVCAKLAGTGAPATSANSTPPDTAAAAAGASPGTSASAGPGAAPVRLCATPELVALSV